MSGVRPFPARALILSAQYPREHSRSRFSTACLASIVTIHRVFVNSMGKVMLIIPGNSARTDGVTFWRAEREGDPGLTKPLPTRCTAGDRERVKGPLSGSLTGLLFLEPPECEIEESLRCLVEDLPVTEDIVVSVFVLACRLGALPNACWETVLPLSSCTSWSVSSLSVMVSESDPDDPAW